MRNISPIEMGGFRVTIKFTAPEPCEFGALRLGKNAVVI